MRGLRPPFFLPGRSFSGVQLGARLLHLYDIGAAPLARAVDPRTSRFATAGSGALLQRIRARAYALAAQLFLLKTWLSPRIFGCSAFANAAKSIGSTVSGRCAAKLCTCKLRITVAAAAPAIRRDVRGEDSEPARDENRMNQRNRKHQNRARRQRIGPGVKLPRRSPGGSHCGHTDARPERRGEPAV